MKSSTDLLTQHLAALVPSNAYGIYIHVPFCERRCKYCAFVSSVARPVPSEDYAHALCQEIQARNEAFTSRKLATVYWGGGTPTMLADRDIEKVMTHIHHLCGDASEITLEANPEHVNPVRAQTWKSLGFSRVSLGVQSFDDDMLALLGRRHNKKRVLDAICALQQAGLDEICIDLIYGARSGDGKSQCEIERWKNELITARELPITHVSCYELTLEPHTPLCTAQNSGQSVLCEDDLIADMMAIIPEGLGMTRYEISNYSRDGYFSAHNVSCWAGLPYLGVGPGAHSFVLDGENSMFLRRANSGHVRNWLASMQTHGHAEPEFIETLTPTEHLAERLMCAARTRFWWHPERIAHEIGAELAPFLSALNKALTCQLVEQKTADEYRTTELGIALNNRLDTILFSSL